MAKETSRDVVLVDFDGVILDSEASALVAWEALYARTGLTVDPLLWQRVAGRRDARDFLLDALVAEGPHVDRAEAARWWLQRQHALAGCLPLSPAVRGALSRARGKGLRLAVASSATRDWIEPHLRRFGIFEWFERIVSGEGRAPKPDPAVYLAALAECAVPAERAIAIEDSPAGIRSAQSAGVDCVGLINPVHNAAALSEATWVVDSLDALWPATSASDSTSSCAS